MTFNELERFVALCNRHGFKTLGELCVYLKAANLTLTDFMRKGAKQ